MSKTPITDLERQEVLAFALFQLQFTDLELPADLRGLSQKEVWQAADDYRKAFRQRAIGLENLAESVGLDIRAKKPTTIKEKIASFQMLPPQPAYQLGE